jgi:S-DNA-T family DNA segregation ATPase FtsK/SpoIIIE
MATTKKRSKGPSRGTSGKSSKKGGPAQSPLSRFSWAVRREVAGAVLLVLGLFFTAAFLSGRGAFLGEAGRAGATHLLGVTGLSLAPLAALAGGLMLARRMILRQACGAALILLAAATTLSAFLPPGRRFEAGSYVEAGGIVGSGLYSVVGFAAGTIGVVLVLCVLYVLGLSLLTGIGLVKVFEAIQSGGRSLLSKTRAARARRRQSVTDRPRPGRPVREERDEERPPVNLDLEIDDDPEGPGALEVVLPETSEPVPLESRDSEPGEYVVPPLSLLRVGRSEPEHDAEGTSRRLTEALTQLGVEAQVVRAVVGPRVTRYELRLGSGVKVGKVRNLQQDIAYALAATEVRILAPIPGKSAVGVEVPNTKPATVTLGDVFREYPGANDWSLPVGLGKDISGRAVFLDLAQMPHLLVAGTTGSGKSVMLNCLLTSLLLTTDPRQVKMVLIDPKRVELSHFAKVPHLITPVVTDVKKAANALLWAVAEMERRYEVLERAGVRSLEGYNERSDSEMPYVVVVIDELADLMMTAAAKVEDAVIRLAQKARAVGIHLVLATQRPSVDVITGMIKANVPSRIAFAVSSQVDSRVILDGPGAESLLGMGDMLYKPVSAMRPSRVQGAWISPDEVDRVVSASISAARGDAEPQFIEEVTEPREEATETEEPEDDLVPEAASFVISTQQASVSAVQRRFRVGYSRAGRIIDALERKGVVGPYEGSKSRSVVANELDIARIFGGEEEHSGETR